MGTADRDRDAGLQRSGRNADIAAAAARQTAGNATGYGSVVVHAASAKWHTQLLRSG